MLQCGARHAGRPVCAAHAAGSMLSATSKDTALHSAGVCGCVAARAGLVCTSWRGLDCRATMNPWQGLCVCARIHAVCCRAVAGRSRVTPALPPKTAGSSAPLSSTVLQRSSASQYIPAQTTHVKTQVFERPRIMSSGECWRLQAGSGSACRREGAATLLHPGCKAQGCVRERVRACVPDTAGMSLRVPQ